MYAKKIFIWAQVTSRKRYTKLVGVWIFKSYSDSLNDYSLLFKKNGSLISIIVFYVNDTFITENDLDVFASMKLFVDSKCRIKDLGEIHYFLGYGLCENHIDAS